MHKIHNQIALLFKQIMLQYKRIQLHESMLFLCKKKLRDKNEMHLLNALHVNGCNHYASY